MAVYLLTVLVMSSCSGVSWSVLCLLLCAAATNTNTGIMLLPRNLTVREGEDATFTCELPCSHEAFWYIGDYANSFPLPFTDSEPDLTYSRGFPDGSCEITDPGSYIDSLTILATPELNNVAVQCSASMINCESGDDSCGDIMYSRFRILRVVSEDTPPTPTPTDSSSSSSSFCPPVRPSTTCPSPSPVVVTSVETSISTATSTQTVTSTETSIVLQPTSDPAACAPTATDSSDASLLKGIGLTSAVIVSSLLVIVSVLLHL